MGIAMGVFLIASVFEIRYLFRQSEKKEALIYICIAISAFALFAFLVLTPQFYSFARMMNSLFGAR